MQSAFHRSTRRRLLALWHRGLTLVVCVSLLHLPVPVLHRHDEIESADVLARHLAAKHTQTQSRFAGDEQAESNCECPEIHESHWHLVMPSQRGDGGEPEHGVPHAETDFVVVADGSLSCAHVLKGNALENVCSLMSASSSSSSSSGCHIGKLDHSIDRWHRCGHAAAATQVYRCALSCVMRC